MSDLARLLGPMRRALGNMVARGVVAAVNAGAKMQSLQMRLLADESKSDVEHFEPYGFTSHPKGGAEGVVLFPDGDRSHGFLVVVADRRYRLTGLREGEVALHDDQGQKVHLTRDGIVIDGAGLPILVHNTPEVTLDTPQVRMTGNLQVDGDITATGDISDHDNESMAGMRSTYNGHDHNETQAVTSQPNQQM